MRNYYGIYADLDSLFDTRISTLYQYSPELVEDLLIKEKYHTRDEDVFGDLNREAFYNIYKERTVDTLKASTRTQIIAVIARILLEMERKRIDMPFLQISRLTINTYPYELSDEDKIEIQEAFYLYLTDAFVVIDVSYIPPYLLTPAFIRDNYDYVFMYEWVGWVNFHKDNFLNINCMEVEFILPGIYTDNEVDRLAIKELKETDDQNPFEIMELLLAGMFKAKFIKAEMFSFDIPELEAPKEK